MPFVDVPPVSYGIWVIGSLVAILIFPRAGVASHLLVVVLASICDQYRLQPQFLAIFLLMLAAVSETGTQIARWFLASLWLWAGLHKMLSPHWFAHAGYWLVNSVVVNDDIAWKIYWQIAMGVSLAEIATGMLAVIRPGWAAVACLLMHTGIALILLLIEWNHSVVPWNLATAIIGFWIMRQIGTTKSLARQTSPLSRAGASVLIAVLMAAPAGFYWGFLDHGYSHVLYSDLLPRGLIVNRDRLVEISGWGRLRVPFPAERRTLRKYFELVAEDGAKMHVVDPRPALPDQYFLKTGGVVVEIDAKRFYHQTLNELRGVGLDSRLARFWLKRSGQLVVRPYNDMDHNAGLITYAYRMDPDRYNTESLHWLSGLPNLEQLQLDGCPVTDADLELVARLDGLTGIGLSNTSITDAGLEKLSSLRNLRILEVENTQVSPMVIAKLKKLLGR
jgi:hypothetical protein